MTIAHYHLPGLFEFYELYCRFLPLYRNHPENVGWKAPQANQFS